MDELLKQAIRHYSGSVLDAGAAAPYGESASYDPFKRGLNTALKKLPVSLRSPLATEKTHGVCTHAFFLQREG